MFACTGCRKEYEEQVKFCPECGAKIVNEPARHSQTAGNDPNREFFPGIMSPTAAKPQPAYNDQTGKKLNIPEGGIAVCYLFFICAGILAGILGNIASLIIGASIAFIILWITHIIKAVKRNSFGLLLLLIFLPAIGIIVSGFTAE